MDLFTHASQQRMKSETPLAARMRPRTLDEYVGQEDILGPGQATMQSIVLRTRHRSRPAVRQAIAL